MIFWTFFTREPSQKLGFREGGKPIRITEKWAADPSRAEFDLSSKVGAVFVRGDDFPRADKIVLTPLKDPGPGYKGHVAIQVANDYKEDMLVPIGLTKCG